MSGDNALGWVYRQTVGTLVEYWLCDIYEYGRIRTLWLPDTPGELMTGLRVVIPGGELWIEHGGYEVNSVPSSVSDRDIISPSRATYVRPKQNIRFPSSHCFE